MQEQIDIMPYQRTEKRNRKKITFKKMLPKKAVLLSVAGLFMGRTSIFLGMSPFGVAWLAAASHKKFSPLLAAFIFLGTLMQTYDADKPKYIIAVLILSFLLYTDHMPKKILKRSLLVSLSLLTGGMVQSFYTGFSIYFALYLVLESMLGGALVYIFERFSTLLHAKRARQVLSREEMTVSIITVSILAVGIGNINLPYGLELINIVSIFLVMVFALKFSTAVAASAGVLLGLMCSLKNSEMVYSMASFAMAGFMAGLFSKYKKSGVILAFVASNALLTFYINGSNEVLINLYEILAAALVLALIPDKVLDKLARLASSVMPNKDEKDAEHVTNLKEVFVNRLSGISASFEKLAQTFSKTETKERKVNAREISGLIDNAANRVCKDCALCSFCWQNDFNATYKSMYRMFAKIEEKGWIERKQADEIFSKRCSRVDELTAEMNKLYELFRVNTLWENKINESRKLVSEQLKGVSGIVNTLATEISQEISFDSKLGQEIVFKLDALGVTVYKTVVGLCENNRYKVSMTVKNCKGMRKCEKEILFVLKHVLGRDMEKKNGPCRINNNKCNLEFKEQAVFSVNCGVARVRKNGQNECGDNYAIIRLNEGKCVSVVSDGMGSGKRAADESSDAVSLLQQLLEAGFKKDMAIKLINSVLVLKSAEENFATLDMGIVDLYSGQCEIIKIGAASSFLRTESNIEVIGNNTLPAGVLSCIETKVVKRQVCDGDILVLVSDGVIETREHGPMRVEWFCRVLDEAKSDDPQDLADYLMQESLKVGEGKAHDDMTILVMRVTQNSQLVS